VGKTLQLSFLHPPHPSLNPNRRRSSSQSFTRSISISNFQKVYAGRPPLVHQFNLLIPFFLILYLLPLLPLPNDEMMSSQSKLQILLVALFGLVGVATAAPTQTSKSPVVGVEEIVVEIEPRHGAKNVPFSRRHDSQQSGLPYHISQGEKRELVKVTYNVEQFYSLPLFPFSALHSVVDRRIGEFQPFHIIPRRQGQYSTSADMLSKRSPAEEGNNAGDHLNVDGNLDANVTGRSSQRNKAITDRNTASNTGPVKPKDHPAVEKGKSEPSGIKKSGMKGVPKRPAKKG
jgi:hypothetical protein